jgi:hypothetical protein
MKHLKRARNSGKRCNSQYRILHGVMYYHFKGVYGVYVPLSLNLRKKLLKINHDTPVAGHFGVEKCYRALSQIHSCFRMQDDVAVHVRSCPACQRNKPTPSRPVALLPLPVASRPFESISLDWLSTFPENKKKNDSVLNIVCRFCKWVIIARCNKNMETEKLCLVL